MILVATLEAVELFSPILIEQDLPERLIEDVASNQVFLEQYRLID